MATAGAIEGLDIRVVEWVRRNRRVATIGAGALALIGGGIWFWLTARERRENFAERALQSARSSAEAGNLPLATSDLARLVSTYGGTRAAQEATLLLAQVRLLQNQPALAAVDLRTFIASGPREEFRGPANGLLGAALEESGQAAEAAKAYEVAASVTKYNGVQSQYLLDAARAYSIAGDTASAARALERILTELGDDAGASAVEAKVRLAELRLGNVPAPKKSS